jgi:hypothetical protein
MFRLTIEKFWKKGKVSTGPAPYQGKTFLLATMHGKEEAISPPFKTRLECTILSADLDTDRFGTFTGEIERTASPIECARKKCEGAFKRHPFKLAIASEGSFGPHPAIPFVPCDHEILYFIDRERGFHLSQSLISLKTNHRKEAVGDLETLHLFADKALFPSHALIVRPFRHQKNSPIFKGIRDPKQLEEAFLECSRLSDDHQVSVETDMRAHMNPTRMGVIGELAAQFAQRLATLCPSCSNPGWGLTGNLRGLPCSWCGSETEMCRSEIYGCPKCRYEEIHPRSDGLIAADPQYCFFCNP